MLDLRLTAAPKSFCVTIFAQAKWIPITNGRLNTELALEGAKWRRRVQGPVAPRRASQAVLEEHAHDCYHRKAAICDFSAQLLGLLRRVIRREHLPAVVTWSAAFIVLEAPAALHDAGEEDDLHPAERRNLREGRHAVGNVGERQTIRGADHTWPLVVLRYDVTSRRNHTDATVLNLYRAAALEGGEIAIGSEAEGVPETDWLLNAELALEGAQRRSSIERPVAPRRASEAILEEHPDDRHHCQTAVCDF